jgi:hypothetical protein
MNVEDELVYLGRKSKATKLDVVGRAKHGRGPLALSQRSTVLLMQKFLGKYIIIGDV